MAQGRKVAREHKSVLIFADDQILKRSVKDYVHSVVQRLLISSRPKRKSLHKKQQSSTEGLYGNDDVLELKAGIDDWSIKYDQHILSSRFLSTSLDAMAILVGAAKIRTASCCPDNLSSPSFFCPCGEGVLPRGAYLFASAMYQGRFNVSFDQSQI